jgi:hypothetical protein
MRRPLTTQLKMTINLHGDIYVVPVVRASKNIVFDT